MKAFIVTFNQNKSALHHLCSWWTFGYQSNPVQKLTNAMTKLLKLMVLLINNATTPNLCVKMLYSCSVQDCSCAEPKFIHCSENHSAGDRVWSRWEHEQDILGMADGEKVTIQRAEQMLTNNLDSFNPKPKSKFSTHFDFDLSAVRKRQLFLLEKCIENHSCSKPRTFGTKDATTFIIDVSSFS